MANEWNEALPDNDELVSDLPGDHRATKVNVSAVLELEHEELGDGNSGCQHRLGSAVVNEGTTTPTKTVDITAGAVALADIARDRGRLWIDDNFDPPVIKRWDGTAWEVLGRVIVDAESVAFDMYNQKHEDGAGGRECQIRAHGEQSGGEATTLGYVEISHEGAGDDEKGQLRVFLNDGDDSDTPTLVMTIPSTGVPPTMAESTAPAADAQLANKKYIDDQIAFSAYTNEDSDAQALAKDHAYLAATDGFVHVMASDFDQEDYLNGYVGNTDDPSGAGDLIESEIQGSNSNNAVVSIGFEVAAGEYFEITSTAGAIDNIWWKSRGTLSKPVDQD